MMTMRVLLFIALCCSTAEGVGLSLRHRNTVLKPGGTNTSALVVNRLYDLHKSALGVHASQSLCVCASKNRSLCNCTRPVSKSMPIETPSDSGDQVLQITAFDKNRRSRLANVEQLEAKDRVLKSVDSQQVEHLRRNVLANEIDSLVDDLVYRSKDLQSISNRSDDSNAAAPRNAIFDLLRDSHYVLSVPSVQTFYNRMKAEIVAKQSDIVAIQRGMNIIAQMKANGARSYRIDSRARQQQVALGNKQVFAASAAQQRQLDALHKQLEAQSGATLEAIQARKKALEDELKRQLEAYMARLGQKNPDLENLRKQAGLLRQQVSDAQSLLAQSAADTLSPCMTSDDCALHQSCRHRMCTPVEKNALCHRNGDCGNGLFCDDKHCKHVTPAVGSQCSSNTECGFGTKCKFFRCVLTPEGHACSADQSCGNGQQCIAHQCRWIKLPENASCTHSRECAFGQTCNKGHCLFVPSGTTCGGRRTLQGSCGVQQICANGQCAFLSADASASCHTTDDCSLGQLCSFRLGRRDGVVGASEEELAIEVNAKSVAVAAGHSGSCTFAQFGRTCEDSLECVFGQRCTKHICEHVMAGTACAQQSDCGNGQSCIRTHNGSSVCHGRRDASVPCNVNSQCGAGQRCMGHLCVSVLRNAKCVDSNDCGNHMTCKDLRCQFEVPSSWSKGATASAKTALAKVATPAELFPVKAACKTAADCAAPSACVFGICENVPVENAFCRDSSDTCALNQECEHNICNPHYELGKIQEGGVCRSTDDCANGQICQTGHCHIVLEGATCRNDAACGRNQICLHEKCFSNGASCSSNFNCADGQRCVGDRCEGSSLEPAPPPCSSHSDCGNGQLCSLRKRVCEIAHSPKREGDACSSMKGQLCSSGQRCTAARCRTVKVGTPCSSREQCGLSQSCFAGFCMWTQPADGTRCSTAFDCGVSQNCVDATAIGVSVQGLPDNTSICLTVPDYFECQGASQCGNGQLCRGGACRTVVIAPTDSCDDSEPVAVNTSSPAALSATAKTRKQQCGARQSCVDGKCKSQFHTGLNMPAGATCTDSYFCGSGQRCLGGVCHAVESYDQCQSNADCGNGQRCHKSHCLNVFFGSHCLGSFDCGVRQLCQSNKCIPQYGNTLTTSVPAGSRCASHVQCSFNMLCDQGRCKFASSSSCQTNGDCGNGVRCDVATNKCVATPHGSFCNSGGLRAMLPAPIATSSDTNSSTALVKCGNGQLCLKSRCSDQYGRGAPTMNIPVGTNCFGSADCGYSQRCDTKCAFVEEGAPCVKTVNCGNGQQCVSGSCVTRPEGRPCESTKRDSSADCAHGQSCVNGVCLRQYGRSLEIELAVRAEEDFSMDKEWKSAVMSRLSAISALIASLSASNKTDASAGLAANPSAAKAELNKLSEEQRRLREGRRILEAEVQRRADASFADGLGGGLLNEGCALCKVSPVLHVPFIVVLRICCVDDMDHLGA